MLTYQQGYQDNFEQWFNHSTEPQDPTATVPPTLVDTLGIQEAPPALLFPENVFDLGSFPHEPDDFPAPPFEPTAPYLPYAQSDVPNDFPAPSFKPTASHLPYVQLDVPNDFLAPSFKPTTSHLPYVQSDAPNDFPVPPFEPTAPQMQDSSLSHIRSNYLRNTIVGPSRPAWYRGSQWEELGGVFQKPGTQRLVHNLKRTKYPNASASASSTSAPSTLAPSALAPSTLAPPVPVPTSTTTLTNIVPDHILRASSETVRFNVWLH